jgi:TonB family protein
MKPVESLLASPLAGAIGWTLLHSLWEGAIVSAVLAALLALLRTPRMRYLAAGAAMLATVVLFGITLAEIAPTPSHSSATVRPMHAVWPNHSDGSEVGWHPNLTAAVPWLTPLWMVGVLLMLTRHLAGCLAVQRLRVRGVCSVPESWQREVAYWSGRLRISRPVQVLESCLADAPMVLGFVRPLILLPVGLLSGLSCTQVESILLHELAHIRRHDYLINALQGFVEGLFFYHPAVWWISRVLRTEREHCCDDVAVAMSGRAYEYALALAALEESRIIGRSPAVAATGGGLVKRIHRLLYPKTNGAWAPFLAAIVLVVTCAATLAAWPLKPVHRYSSMLQSESERGLGIEYSKWLNEDVGYIIDDAERAAFLRLSTDQERDKFVVQFWERRNPTPGAPNKFKEEHYRRLAYANQHFAAGLPGWRTDRGHIYIVYGPPDEIESHPRENGSIEIWLYHHVEGIGDNATLTFVDGTGQGEFRLAPGTPFVKEQIGPKRSPAPSEGENTSAETSQPVRVAPDVMSALIRKKVAPQYPETARSANIEGSVVLDVTIGKDGDVENLQIVSGHPQLVPAAIEAVKEWRYKPYLLNGEAVVVETEVTVNFTLSSQTNTKQGFVILQVGETSRLNSFSN